jgi:hypothetical protein
MDQAFVPLSLGVFVRNPTLPPLVAVPSMRDKPIAKEAAGLLGPCLRMGIGNGFGRIVLGVQG